jgi:hypothetical protein
MKPKQQSLVRWDRKEKRDKVKALAAHQGMKLNRFINWLADMALAQHEAESRFRAAAARRNPQKAIRILEALHRADRRAGIGGTKP